MNEISGRGKIVFLDLWAGNNASAGSSKKWLQTELRKSFDISILNADYFHIEKAAFLLKAFSFNRTKWGEDFYALVEGSAKTIASFSQRTRNFQKAFDQLQFTPDAVLQFGGLFGPLALPCIPYVTYHDQTVRMVERGWPRWLPQDFQKFREKWYALEGNLYRSVDRVITYSECTRQSMIRDYGVPEEKVIVIPTACKMKPATQDETDVPAKKQLIFVSTDFLRKGGDIILNAFPLIKQAHPDLQLIIAGGKLPAGTVIEDSAIRYAGNLPHNELRRYLLESILLIHPARYDAFPNVLKEALSCGLPVVASQSCGIPEIVRDEHSGVILRDLEPQTLAETVIELLNNEDVIDSFRKNALAESERFQVGAVGDEFRKLLDEVIRG